LGTSVEIKAQGIGENGFSSLGHAPILRSDWPPNKRLQPTARSGILSAPRLNRGR
jgi:hypothetical protein